MSIFSLQFVAYRPPLIVDALRGPWAPSSRGGLGHKLEGASIAMSKLNNRSTLQLLHSTLGLTHGSENCCVTFSVKKLMPQFWAPLGPRAPPHCGVCGVSSYATGSLSKNTTPYAIRSYSFGQNINITSCICIMHSS